MKLIIDLPQNTYNEVLSYKDTSNTTIYNSIRNAIGFQEILEKIRAEIDEYKSTIDNAISEDELKIEGMKEAYSDSLKIIDNRIAELKGENE